MSQENPLEKTLPFLLKNLNPVELQTFSSLVVEYKDRASELKQRCQGEPWFSKVKVLFTEHQGQELHASVSENLLRIAEEIQEIEASQISTEPEVKNISPTINTISTLNTTPENPKTTTSLFMMISIFLPGLLSNIQEFGTPDELDVVKKMLTDAQERQAHSETDTPEAIEEQYNHFKRKYRKEITQKAFEIAMGTRKN